MARNYNMHCWLCNSTDLEPDERGMQCRSCGATYNVIPKLGSDPITEQRDNTLSPKGKRTIKTGSPSGTIMRRAAKAQGDVHANTKT